MATKQPGRGRPAPESRLRVVVVNEDPRRLRATCEALGGKGMEAIPSSGAEEGLRAMDERGPVDGVVADLCMSGIDGLAFCRLLRSPEYARFNEVPVLLAGPCGCGREAEEVCALAGANGFLGAPWQPAELRKRVRAMARGRTRAGRPGVLITGGRKGRVEALRRAFEEQGFEAFLAPTGRRGLELAEKRRPRVVVFHSSSRGMSAEGFLEALCPRGADVVVVVIGGAAARAGGLDLAQRGACACLSESAGEQDIVRACLNGIRERTLVAGSAALETRTRELLASESTFRSVFDVTPEGVLIHDEDGIILYVNQVAAGRLGRSPEELVGTDLHGVVSPPQADRMAADARHAVAEGALRFETTHISCSGQRVRAEVTESPILFNGRRAILSVSRDITERKEAEEAHERLATAVEQAGEAIIITDTEGTIQYVNPAFERVSGYRREEAVGKTPRLLKSGRHDAPFYRRLWDRLTRGEVWSGRFVNRRKDGTLFEEEATISPVRDASGKIVSYVAVKRDVSQQASLEAQLRQAQKMEAIGTLAGGVAHDFNNLLTGILGYSNLLKLEAKPGSPVYDAADRIEKAAEQAAQLTRQLLGFARRGKHQNVPVDLHSTIAEAVGLLRRTLDKNIRVVEELRAANPHIVGDPAQMHQVVLNLALNARDAMPEGGELAFATDVVDLDDEFCRTQADLEPGRCLRLTVTDTGCGIPPELQPRIFEPFVTTKEPGKGTGMGLAMVYGIVKNHRGSVGVESDVGHGARFTVYLPLAHEAQAAPVEPPAPALKTGKGRILLVDDEAVVRQVGSEMLRYLGYEVVAVSDGRECIEYYRRFGREVDLVIIDMIMPGMGGRECFRTLKALDPGVKTILSTGYGVESGVQEILDEGMAGFVQKPYEISHISEAVAAVLARR